MSTNDDRRAANFRDRAPEDPTQLESPADLAESPTVDQPEVSPAAKARAALPEWPGPGMKQDVQDNPLPVRNPRPGSVLTEREPRIDPGAPLGSAMGEPRDDAPPAAGPHERETIAGTRMPQAERNDLDRHGGTPEGHTGAVAGLDETSGTDDAPDVPPGGGR